MFSRLLRLFYTQKRYYRSDIQKFLDNFDTNHTLSASQKAEINKHQPIHTQRDQSKSEKTERLSWLDDDTIN